MSRREVSLVTLVTLVALVTLDARVPLVTPDEIRVTDVPVATGETGVTGVSGATDLMVSVEPFHADTDSARNAFFARLESCNVLDCCSSVASTFGTGFAFRVRLR